MGRRALADREPVRLELEAGDWILVKPELSHGETDAFFAAVRGPDWRREYTARDVDPIRYNDALVGAWLVDWSFEDHDGKPLMVTPTAIQDLKGAAFRDVLRAIERHVGDVERRDADQKKTPITATNSEPISLSAS